MIIIKPAKARGCPVVEPMLGRRLRRWISVGPTLGQRRVFAEKTYVLTMIIIVALTNI